MKAVNLIPREARGGRSPKAGAATLAVHVPQALGAYVLLAALTIGVLMAGAWAMTGRQLSDDRADLARTEQVAQAAEAKVVSLRPYTAFAALSSARVQTLSGLIDGRFDWSSGLREVARVIPRDVDLLSLVGTTSPTSSVQGAGAGGSLRSALPVPAIDLIGCAKSQSRVAELLARLRSIDGVQRVSLASSEKSDSTSSSDSDCRASSRMPQFQVTIFFRPQAGIVPAAAATTPAAATASTAPSATGAAATAAPGGAK